MKTCARKIEFCYAHRLMNHEGKCANFHGHNGIVWIYATTLSFSPLPSSSSSSSTSISPSTLGLDLDKVGRIVDFAVLKEKVGGWIENNWDHKTILNSEDKSTIEILNKLSTENIFLLDNNPTAENLAHYLLWEVCPLVLKGLNVFVNKVVFYETSNCLAEEIALDCNMIDELKKRYR
ncbi:MAG: 6-carboxytetrahydropterin synthase [Oligoflexia bacterium]|nr:6-carboxytetrahydropterin synthase [Oligoflexia bacterium]